MKYRVIHAPTGEVVIEPTEATREEIEADLELGFCTAAMIVGEQSSVDAVRKDYKIEEVEE